MYIMDSEETGNDGRECDTVQVDFTVVQYVVFHTRRCFSEKPKTATVTVRYKSIGLH